MYCCSRTSRLFGVTVAPLVARYDTPALPPRQMPSSKVRRRRWRCARAAPQAAPTDDESAEGDEAPDADSVTTAVAVAEAAAVAADAAALAATTARAERDTAMDLAERLRAALDSAIADRDGAIADRDELHATNRKLQVSRATNRAAAAGSRLAPPLPACGSRGARRQRG